MKKLVFNSDEQKKNKISNMFSFTKESKIEVLKHYEMNKIRGGAEDEADANQEWKD